MSRAEERRIGEIVGGKYRVVRFLAAGGMGVVYEAKHAVVKRRFAVKFLRPELAEKRDALARFQREAQAAGALEGENLAAAVDFGVASDGSPFIVMEYLSGESVESLLEREGPLPLARATDLVQQACRGTQAAHAAGIVHRDLKPQNLFLCRREDGTDLLKILDFGIAKLEAVEQVESATVTGTVLGTPAYMSPEQARGDKTIDHRADVYALGAILYELTSGKKPHPGDSHNAILHHIATQPPVPLDFVEPPLPGALTLAIERALASDPSARFASAELFEQAISEWSERKVWPAPELLKSSPRKDESDPTELAQGIPEPAAGVPERVSATGHEGGVRRSDAGAPSRRPIFALIALGGAAVLLSAWLLATSNGDSARPVPEAANEAAAPERPVAREVNAAELPLPPAPAAEPTLAPSVAPTREPARVRTSGAMEASGTVRPQSPPSSPGPAKSASPLTFDRQNPYD